SIDATTTRASTVIKSMPTRDTRTHASMTMPLSRTRSRTSMRLLPPAVRSTTATAHPSFGCCAHSLQLLLELRDARLQPRDLVARGVARETRFVTPPVEPDLLGLVDRADQEPDTDREQLDVRERDADVAGDDQTLVEHAVEQVDERRR